MDIHHAEETLDSLKFKKQEKPQKTITKKLKLIKIKKRKLIKSLNFKQTVDQTSSIAGANKS